MKKLLLGDEAIAQGAIDAGLSGVYAYPGTPSTEITEYIQDSPIAKERNIHRRWSTNEKTAMEAALGMSYMGKRALVCMKHVGLNVCADPFVNSAMTHSTIRTSPRFTTLISWVVMSGSTSGVHRRPATGVAILLHMQRSLVSTTTITCTAIRQRTISYHSSVV